MRPKTSPRSLHWWYWFATLVAMVAGLAGRREGFYAVVAISAVQFVHFLATDGFAALTTQVRLVYGTFTVIALFDPTGIFWVVLLFGTFMVTFFDRCVIAKVLLRMPWNREIRAEHARSGPPRSAA